MNATDITPSEGLPSRLIVRPRTNEDITEVSLMKWNWRLYRPDDMLIQTAGVALIEIVVAVR